MYRRDYIQRMIEEVARSLSRAMGLRKDGLDEQALETVREAYHTFFSMEAELVARLHPDDMLTFFTGQYELKNEQKESLSHVLEAEGMLLAGKNPEESDDRLRKALVLLEHLDATDKATFSIDRRQRIENLREKLKNDPEFPADENQ
ncbi:MAG: hypothetical protein FD123_3023 [Bacteroidetes bacterium]|nr:MAG: hypothetical protein FD123_3023 [Bacteroidota bacterium]